MATISKATKPEMFFTVSIVLSQPTEDGKTGLVYKNVSKENLDIIQRGIYTRGIAYTMRDTGTIELISPFNIHKIFIIPQKEKIE